MGMPQRSPLRVTDALNQSAPASPQSLPFSIPTLYGSQKPFFTSFLILAEGEQQGLGLQRLALMTCRRSVNTTLGVSTEQLAPRARAKGGQRGEELFCLLSSVGPVADLLSKVLVRDRKKIGQAT